MAMSVVATSCSDFLDEQNEDGMYDSDIIWASPALAEGVLLKGYQLINTEYASANRDMDDYCTSDMATNRTTNTTITIATGSWTSSITHLSFYDTAYQAILHINDFIANAPSVDFAVLSEDGVKELYQKKLLGEAYALRAWWYMKLLCAHAGESESGELLGVPIVKSVVSGEEAKLPRDSFADCIKFVVEDCDAAIALLPSYWVAWSEDVELDGVTYAAVDYNRVMGTINTNRINGMTARQIKSRALLMAASEAFDASGYTWAEAAEAAADMIDIHKAQIGTEYGLEDSELAFYTLQTGSAACKSILWCSSYLNNITRENNMYAPSLYGNGYINPSQNLVDCFPMADGTPISESATYSDQTPFADRDPRLALFVYCDGATLRENGGGTTTLDITTGLTDAPGGTTTASRTGYYLRKLLDETTDLTPNLNVKGYKYRTHARYTETLLNFAEAANEVSGPDTEVNGYTAKEIINAIRTRAGITSTSYVDAITSVEDMRELIRNERRIELCFENFRFYDMHRWADTDGMNENVVGITKSGGTYSYPQVEVRSYADYMIYGPIPYSETLKYDLVQNKGWD